jgi:hypothetical protein
MLGPSLNKRFGAFSGLMFLGCSGLVSALALLLLASNLLPGIPSDLSSGLLLGIQLHVAGLTIGKFGADYAIFTVVSRRPELHFDVKQIIRMPLLPTAVAFSTACVPLFGPWGAAALGCSVLADTLSTLFQAQFTARRQYAGVAIGNVLNYPLFVAMLFSASHHTDLQLELGLGIFALSRATRLLWFVILDQRHLPGETPFTLSSQGYVAAQGILNLGLFRLDQLALALTWFKPGAVTPPVSLVSAYVFLARLPEIATGILVLVGTVLFPQTHLRPITSGIDWRPAARLCGSIAVLAAAFTLLAIVLASSYLESVNIPAELMYPFAVHVALILPANLVTFSMQSYGYLPALLRNYGVAISIGALATIGFVVTSSLTLLAWVVPLQLGLVLALTAALPWGTPLVTHRSVNE